MAFTPVPSQAILRALHAYQMTAGARLNGEDTKRGTTYLVTRKWLVHSGGAV